MSAITDLRQRHKLKDDTKVGILNTLLVVKSEQSDPYKFTARITTDAVDRQDEVVIPSGGMFAEFLASGAIFWNHDYTKPVGYPDKTKQIIKGENFVEAGGVFMKRPADCAGEFFPDFVREFVMQGMQAGINPGVSIGFIPVETRRPSKADIAKYGQGIQLVHSKWKLLEFSIAPVQANQEAVVTAVGKGLMKRETVKALGIVIPDAPPPKVQKCVIAIPKSAPQQSAVEMARNAVKRELYKRFGQIYLR